MKFKFLLILRIFENGGALVVVAVHRAEWYPGFTVKINL